MHANLSSETSCSKKLNGLLYYCPKLHTHFLLMQSLLTFKKVQSLKHTLKFLLISNTGWMDKHLFRNIEKFSDKHSLRETESGFTPPSMSEPVNCFFILFLFSHKNFLIDPAITTVTLLLFLYVKCGQVSSYINIHFSYPLPTLGRE